MPTQAVMELKTGNVPDSLSEQLYERELSLCARAGGDEKALREAGYNVLQLEQIRQGLEEGLDVSVFMHQQYSWLDMEEIRKGLKQGIDMSRYREAGYSTEQKREIRKGIARGVDVSKYDKIEYLGEQMRQLRLALMDGQPIALFSNPAYNAAQMEEIRLGLKHNVDISLYARTDMPYLKMRAIRKSMEDGLTFTDREIADYDESILEQLYKAHVAGVNIRPYLEQGYNTLQLEQIRISLEENLHFDPYIRKDMRGESLKEIRLGLEMHLDVSLYAKPEYRWRQMREIRLGLESRVSVAQYANPLFEAAQMRQIRLGLEKGLDVTRYNSLIYTARDMRHMRHALERGENVGRKLFRLPEIPDPVDDPVLPYALRPDPRTLREVLSKEQHTLAARKAGKPVPAEDEAQADLQSLMPALPTASSVPVALFGEGKRSEGRVHSAKVDMHGHNLLISEDGMLCYLSLPKPKEGVTYTEELIHSLLRRSNVVRGIDEEAVRAIIRDARYDEQVIVARGQEPVNGIDGRYEYYFDRRSFTNPDFTEDGTADFSHVHFFSEVQAGDIIASYVRAERGTDGFTVTGEVLPARNGIEKPVLKGRGFILMEDRVSYAAAVSGVAKTDGFELNINRLLTISENVVEVGRTIDFLGSVLVKATLIPGTEIIAQGDIIMETVAESVKLKAGGDIVLKEGATGRSRGHLEAEGTISSNYFANYEIKAHGSIFANSFLHCKAQTTEKLVCFGDNGTIYGGEVSARLGLECAVIGTETGTPTTVILGITTDMIREYNEAEKRAERIASELATIDSQLEKMNALETQSREQMQLKIKIGAAHAIKQKEYQKALEEQERIAAYISSVAGSESLVSKTLYAGTTLFVDETELRISETKEATLIKPIIIKGKARQWQRIQAKR